MVFIARIPASAARMPILTIAVIKKMKQPVKPAASNQTAAQAAVTLKWNTALSMPFKDPMLNDGKK